MTSNQIAYNQHLEDKRHNLISEAETKRSHLADEKERNRSHLADEKERHRTNVINEGYRGAELVPKLMSSMGTLMGGSAKLFEFGAK